MAVRVREAAQVGGGGAGWLAAQVSWAGAHRDAKALLVRVHLQYGLVVSCCSFTRSSAPSIPCTVTPFHALLTALPWPDRARVNGLSREKPVRLPYDRTSVDGILVTI